MQGWRLMFSTEIKQNRERHESYLRVITEPQYPGGIKRPKNKKKEWREFMSATKCFIRFLILLASSSRGRNDDQTISSCCRSCLLYHVTWSLHECWQADVQSTEGFFFSPFSRWIFPHFKQKETSGDMWTFWPCCHSYASCRRCNQTKIFLLICVLLRPKSKA